jgi:hypothetical protein
MSDFKEARELFSKSELKLVESSKIDEIKVLHRKYANMIPVLHSDSRIRTTQRKVELLAEAIQRYEGALQSRGNSELPVEKSEGTALDMKQPRKDPQERTERKSAARDVQPGSSTGSAHRQNNWGSIPRRQQGRRNSSKNH